MKYLSLLILIFPFYLFGQNPDTTCVCGKVAPNIRTPKIVEAMPVYPGGNEVLKDFIKSKTKLELVENGKIEISFIIGCKGTTCGYEVLSRVGLSTETEMKILDVLKKMDKWEPAKQMGTSVDVIFKLSLNITNGILKFDGMLK